MLSEKKTIYRDHLGRPTNTTVLRDNHIASNIKDLMKNSLTPYKRSTVIPTGTTPLRRSVSQLSTRSDHHNNQNHSSTVVKKKNARNLMILGSSSSVKNQLNQHFSSSPTNNLFSLKQT